MCRCRGVGSRRKGCALNFKSLRLVSLYKRWNICLLPNIYLSRFIFFIRITVAEKCRTQFLEHAQHEIQAAAHYAHPDDANHLLRSVKGHFFQPVVSEKKSYFTKPIKNPNVTHMCVFVHISLIVGLT